MACSCCMARGQHLFIYLFILLLCAFWSATHSIPCSSCNMQPNASFQVIAGGKSFYAFFLFGLVTKQFFVSANKKSVTKH